MSLATVIAKMYSAVATRRWRRCTPVQTFDRAPRSTPRRRCIGGFWNILEHAQVFQIKTAGARLYDRSKQTDTRSGTSLFRLIRSVAIRFGYLMPVRLGASLA